MPVVSFTFFLTHDLSEMGFMPAILGFFSPGPAELIILGVVVLLIFGNRLPGVMRSLGKGVVEFKKGISGVEDDEDGAPTKSKP